MHALFFNLQFHNNLLRYDRNLTISCDLFDPLLSYNYIAIFCVMIVNKLFRMIYLTICRYAPIYKYIRYYIVQMYFWGCIWMAYLFQRWNSVNLFIWIYFVIHDYIEENNKLQILIERSIFQFFFLAVNFFFRPLEVSCIYIYHIN